MDIWEFEGKINNFYFKKLLKGWAEILLLLFITYNYKLIKSLLASKAKALEIYYFYFIIGGINGTFLTYSLILYHCKDCDNVLGT